MNCHFKEGNSFVEWKNGKLYNEIINGKCTVKNGIPVNENNMNNNQHENQDYTNMKHQDLKLALDNECKQKNPNLNKILSLLNEKINPDKESMDCLLKKWNVKRYENKKNHQSIKIREQIANLFVKYGYQIDKNDVLTLANIRGEFDYLPKEFIFDKLFRNKLDKVCWDNNLFLYSKHFPINALKNYCGRKCLGYNQFEINEINDIIFLNNIVPNLETIKLLCAYKCDGKIIGSILSKYKIEPDLDCILHCYNLPSNAKYLIERMKKNEEKKKKEEEKKEEEKK
jgi:hypothetical protein